MSNSVLGLVDISKISLKTKNCSIFIWNLKNSIPINVEFTRHQNIKDMHDLCQNIF